MRAPTPLFDFQDPVSAGGFAPADDAAGPDAARCRAEVSGGLLRFEGVLAPEGGAEAIRSAPAPFDLGGATGVALRVRGDGRRYAIELRCDDAGGGVAWCAPFETATGGWQVILLPFDRFEPEADGRPATRAGPLRPSRVRTVGLRAGDGPGPFRLEVAAVACYALDHGVVALPRPAAH